MDPSYLAAQLKELYKNKSEADVIVKCQGETLKAHSFLLAMRFIVLVMWKINVNQVLPFAGRNTSEKSYTSWVEVTKTK